MSQWPGETSHADRAQGDQPGPLVSIAVALPFIPSDAGLLCVQAGVVLGPRPLRLPVRLVHGGHFPSYGGARHREIVTAWLRGKDERPWAPDDEPRGGSGPEHP